MVNTSALLSVLALFLLAASPSAAAATNEDCKVLHRLLGEAQSEFPVLKQRNPGGAWCAYRKTEFKCIWGFSTDRYAEAETQVDRLERCTAAEPNADLAGKKAHQARYQLYPDTRVLIEGPDADDGNWDIQLKITTTAKWN